MKTKSVDPPCNCRKKPDCPLAGQCRVNNLVYQATVTTKENPPIKETYVGLASTQFKDRYRNHTKSFRNEKFKTETRNYP